MSNNSFHFGNSAYRFLIAHITPLSAPNPPYAKACAIAGLRRPVGHTEAVQFSKKCVNGLKKKADLLAELLPGEVKRTQALNLVANTCFFPNWKAFQDAAESFAHLSDGQRASSGDSFKLSLALWQITPNRMDEFVLACVGAASTVLTDKTGLDHDQTAEIMQALFSDKDISRKFSCMTASELLEITNTSYRFPVHQHLMHVLSQKPLKGSSYTTWPDLANITLGKLLKKSVAFDQLGTKIPLSVSDLLVANLMGSVHEFALGKLGYFIPPFEDGKLRTEQERIINALAHPDSHAQASQAVSTLLGPHLSKTVLEAITLPDDENGFISNEYPSSLSAAMVIYGIPVKSGNLDVPGYEMVVFVDEPFAITDNEGANAYRIYAFTHDAEGATCGHLEMFYIHNPSGLLFDLGMISDEIENTDCIELTLSLAKDLGMKPNRSFENVVFISKWEVSTHHQRKGLGKALINAAFNDGLDGFDNPDVVVARLDPAQYPVPILDDVDPSSIPNYARATDVLMKAWDSTTSGGTRFGNIKTGFHPGSYSEICHGHPNLRMGALAFYQMH